MRWSRDVGGFVSALYQTSAGQPSSFCCSGASLGHTSGLDKAPQIWGAQLERWRRSLTWGCLSRSTCIQPGKLSWCWYSSVGKAQWSSRLGTWMWAKSSTSGKRFWCSLVYPLDFCQHNTTDLGHQQHIFGQETKGPGGRSTCSRLWFDVGQGTAWARSWQGSGKQRLLKAASG